MGIVQRGRSSGGKVYKTYLINNLQFPGRAANAQLSYGEYVRLGFDQDLISSVNRKNAITFDVVIPDDLVITEAKITLYHFPTYEASSTTWGYCRNIKAYVSSTPDDIYLTYVPYAEYSVIENTTYNEIKGVLGVNGFTAEVPNSSSHILEKYTSRDLKQYLNSRYVRIKIETADATPPFSTAVEQYNGMVYAVLNVYGYTVS